MSHRREYAGLRSSRPDYTEKYLRDWDLLIVSGRSSRPAVTTIASGQFDLVPTIICSRYQVGAFLIGEGGLNSDV
jgi:hypothetical protein